WALGLYLYKIASGSDLRLERFFSPIERPLLALVGIRGEPRSMDWKGYVGAILWANLLMAMLIYALLALQGVLPLNPLKLGGLEPMLAFNTAVSFITNTNWQAYSGENALSYFSQMAAITFPMFTSAITGLAAGFAFMRGLAGSPGLGNFYADVIRTLVRFFLPVALLGALFLTWQGVPQTLGPSATVLGPQGTAQTLPVGPVASLDSIKHLGTNGGGYYGQNSAHPFENPTPLTNVVQILLMGAVPTALVFTFGRMLGNKKQARVIFWAMAALFGGFLVLVTWAELAGNPLLTHVGLDQVATRLQPGGNMEGKELRFGIAQSALFVTATTAFTTGTVDCMHDSLTALGSLTPLGQMMLNCVFGGKGVGFMNFLMYGILAVFLTGLMVGRTPEIFGKKIEKPEIVLASIAILLHPLIILVPSALAVVQPAALSSLGNPAFHGLSEILYAYTSSAANNGSAFAGLNANTPWYNLSTGIVILLGRYLSIVALLAIAGSLATKKTVPVGPGTLRTDTVLFGCIWVGVILIVGALTFFPVLALGPVAEHLAMIAGKTF
ncbi:MAG: potassium-transporting ATPase subunit KdpA, partial [Cyanobacteria bacterium REEB65]|nr:potassium-transporting ATPase subunit KdpA [Cyanobacteria bacterium REEB65]